MQVFTKLKEIRAFERKYLDCLVTLQDFDIMREIGYHQEAGIVLTLKQLFLLDLGSIATVQRRMTRLKNLGVILQTRLEHDRRACALTMSPAYQKIYARYGSVLGANGGTRPS